MTATRRRPYAARAGLAERREQVLDAALEIIAGSGWRAVSMEAIARAVGVTRPVVYRAYPNLALLLAALLRREQRRALRQLDVAVPEEPGDRLPYDVLREGLHAFFAAVQASPDTWRLIILPVEGTPAVVQRIVVRRRAALQRRIQTLVEWALPRLGAPAQVDAELLARLLLTIAEESGRLVLTDPARWPPERFERTLSTLLDQVAWAAT